MSSIQTAIEQAWNMDGKKLPHVRLGALVVRVWFGIVPNLTVLMLAGIAFIDRFIRGIFPSEGKVVPRYFYMVALSVSSKYSKSSNLTTENINTPPDDTPKTDIQMAEMPTPSRMES